MAADADDIAMLMRRAGFGVNQSLPSGQTYETAVADVIDGLTRPTPKADAIAVGAFAPSSR